MAGGGGALSSILGVCKRKYREPGFLVDSVVLSQSSPTFAPHLHPSRHLGANWKSGPQSLVLFLSRTRVSWTTSFRTRTASSSSPPCTAAKGPSVPGRPWGAEKRTIRRPLGPFFQVSLSPLSAFFPALSPELPPGREKRPGAKNEPFSDTWAGKHAGGRLSPACPLPAAEAGEGAPLACQ